MVDDAPKPVEIRVFLNRFAHGQYLTSFLALVACVLGGLGPGARRMGTSGVSLTLCLLPHVVIVVAHWRCTARGVRSAEADGGRRDHAVPTATNRPRSASWLFLRRAVIVHVWSCSSAQESQRKERIERERRVCSHHVASYSQRAHCCCTIAPELRPVSGKNATESSPKNAPKSSNGGMSSLRARERCLESSFFPLLSEKERIEREEADRRRREEFERERQERERLREVLR